MTKVRLTTDIEIAKHGCEDRFNERMFVDEFAGQEVEVISTAKPQENWLCGTDVVFKCRFKSAGSIDYGIAHLCRHQILAGD